MPEHVHHIVKRLILYICICLLAGIGISGMTAFFHTSFSSTSSILFPLLTSFLMVFHITIACFMGMKYWSSKRRLYLTPVSFGFACSALLMLGTLSSYPDWLTCNPAPVVNQNDAVIYYFFRNTSYFLICREKEGFTVFRGYNNFCTSLNPTGICTIGISIKG